MVADVSQTPGKIDHLLSDLQIELRNERAEIRDTLAKDIVRLEKERRAARIEFLKARDDYNKYVKRVRDADYVNLKGDGVHLFGGFMKEGRHTITPDQFKNKFMLVQDFKSQEEVISAVHGSGAKTKNPVFAAMELAASGIRTTTSTFDAVLPFMHLSPLIGQSPELWAKASLFHYKSFFQPGMQAKHIRENLDDYYDLALNGVSIGDPEVMSLLSPGEGINLDAVFRKYQNWHPSVETGDVSKMSGPQLAERRLFEWMRNAQHISRQGMTQLLGRPQSAYQGGVGYARVLLKQAMETGYEGPSHMMYSEIRNMTGALDSRRLGVSADQRAIESMWLAFSPRLLRSTLALSHSAATAVLKIPAGAVGRNVPGAERFLGTGATAQQRHALEALAKLSTAAVGIYVATGLALGKDWEKDILPGLNPANGRQFLSYHLNGDWYGPGGQIRALAQFTSSMYGLLSDVADDWKVESSLNWTKNPIWYFYQTRGAVGMHLVGGILEAWSGKDVLPFDDVDGFWGRDGVLMHGLTSPIPFTIQQYNESRTWGSAVGSFFLGRVSHNTHDRALSYITNGDQFIYADADPWLKKFAREWVDTGTEYDDAEIKRRRRLAVLWPGDPKLYNKWQSIEKTAKTMRAYYSEDKDFKELDKNDPDPNKGAMAQFYGLFKSSWYRDAETGDTMPMASEDFKRQHEALIEEWTPEQELYVKLNSNMRPIPKFILDRFPNNAVVESFKESLALQMKELEKIGRPELVEVYRRYMLMIPVDEPSRGIDDWRTFIDEMPAKLKPWAQEEVSEYVGRVGEHYRQAALGVAGEG